MAFRGVPVTRRVVLAGGLAATAIGGAAVPAGAAVPFPRGPEIASTEQWGARLPSGPVQVHTYPASQIIVHHTASANSADTSQAHAFSLARGIQNMHMDGNGWIDTGQHFTNSRGGWLTEGRHGSLAALQSGLVHVHGAHARTQNSVALGIENEGTYLSAGVPAALWDSLVRLCTFMVQRYLIAPGEIYGHRDFMSTQCPGDVLYGRLPELRGAVGAATGLPVVAPVPWPLLRPGDLGAAVQALQLLLRDLGFDVPVDAGYGSATQRAASLIAEAQGAVGLSCHATRIPEPGVFAGNAWNGVVKVLSMGATGDAVRAVQLLLTAKGLFVEPDARFGSRMLGVVRSFQEAQGLPVSGVVDHRTWKNLLS